MLRFLLFVLQVAITATAIAGERLNPIPGTSDDIINNTPYYMSDSDNSYMTFGVSIDKTGPYHIAFWLLPIKINDRTYSQYDVYLDGKKVSRVSPSKDGWQLISLEDDKRISISKGEHTVSISVPKGFPLDVEKLYLTKNVIAVNEDCINYGAFLEQCMDAIPIDFVKETESNNSIMSEADEDIVEGIPLIYTFHTFIELRKGENLKLNSFAEIPHCIDVVYRGKSDELSYDPIVPPFFPPIRPFSDNEDFSPPHDPIEGPGFELATARQKAGLTWTTGCRYNQSSYGGTYGRYESRLVVNIPETGRYFLRVRGLNNGSQGTARVEYTTNLLTGEWKIVPISNNYHLVYFPPDYTYICQSYANNPATDNMLLALQLFNGDRIHDYGISEHDYSNGTFSDIFLQNTLHYPTGVISINSMSSSAPESTCTLSYFSSKDSKALYDYMRAKKMVSGNKQDSGRLSSEITMSDSGIVINPCLSGILEIYDINGILIYKRALEDISDVGIVAWEELNISEKGIYIARLITETRIESIKFIR